jgi:hypothetical protein
MQSINLNHNGISKIPYEAFGEMKTLQYIHLEVSESRKVPLGVHLTDQNFSPKRATKSPNYPKPLSASCQSSLKLISTTTRSAISGESRSSPFHPTWFSSKNFAFFI